MTFAKDITTILFICIFLTLNSFGQSNERFSQILKKYETETDSIKKVDYLIELSSLTSWTDINESERYAELALQIAQNRNYRKGIGYAKCQIASIFSDYNYEFAEKLLFQALEDAKAINDSLLMAKSYKLMGNLKNFFKFKESASFYYQKALEIYLENQQDSLAASIYNNLGNLKELSQSDSGSLFFYKKAIDINKSTGNHLWLAINYVNISIDYLESNEIDKAYEYLQLSNKLIEEHNFNRLYSWLYSSMSEYYSLTNEPEKVKEYLFLALRNAQENNNLLQEKEALVKLEHYYIQQGDTEEAYQFLKKSAIVSDSINKNNRLKEIDMMELIHKHEQKNKLQIKENEILKIQHARKELIYIVIIVLISLILVILTLLYYVLRNRIQRKNLEKQKLDQLIEFKNKELTTYVMYLLQKNEFISSISEELKQNYRDENLDKIINELDRNINSNTWSEFEVRFQEVHIDFYSKLSKMYPDLTPNDLRICAFLKLNMSSKEIAEITFQSPDSLKAARYRIRKKLQLSRDQNLSSFLNQF